jgi:capsular polysaccharide transport system permease protein
MIKIPERIGKLPTLFVAAVLVPTMISAVYFTMSSDVYMSESRFVVRSPEKSNNTGLGALFRAGGMSNDANEGYATKDYMVSRDALAALNRDNLVSNAYGNENVSILNRFNPFNRGGVKEKLYKYYTKKVEVTHDVASSITVLSVRAFTPEDAHEINRRLLVQAEALVNKLNGRARSDLINYANDELDEAKALARTAALALSDYHNREGVVDPEKQATVQLQMISKLQDEMIATQTQLIQLRAFTPQNPQIPVLQNRVQSLSREIDKQTGLVAGNQKSLAATAAQFQRLQLESQLADRQLGAAISSLQEARNEARRKRAYVERIVEPSKPDYPLEPRRLRGILSTFVVGLVIWAVLSMLVSGVKEHRD